MKKDHVIVTPAADMPPSTSKRLMDRVAGARHRRSCPVAFSRHPRQPYRKNLRTASRRTSPTDLSVSLRTSMINPIKVNSADASCMLRKIVNLRHEVHIGLEGRLSKSPKTPCGARHNSTSNALIICNVYKDFPPYRNLLILAHKMEPHHIWW